MERIIIGISAESSVVLLEGQLRYLRERGYDTYLLCPYSDRVRKYCETEGCTHIQINIRRDISPLNDTYVLIKLIFLFFRYKPDIINLGTPKISFLGMVAGKVAGIKKRIYTCRGFRFEPETGFKRKMLMRMEKITSWCAHTIICISPSLHDYGIETGIFAKEKSVVIKKGSSNGINLDRFSLQSISRDSQNQLISELGIRGKFVFGFVGRIYDRKGINELYNAFSNLSKKFSEIILLVVGRIEEGHVNHKKILTQLRSHKQIRFVGPQKNVPLYLSLMDVFVLPTWGEGFGNVIVEASAMGVPVISTNATGARDAVRHDYNGLLVQPRSEDLLLNAMLVLYENEELRERLGKNGLEWAKNFDNLIIWKGQEDIYNSARSCIKKF